MSLSTFALVVATWASPFVPHPQEKGDWGVRVHRLSHRGPFLVGEQIREVNFHVTLLNFSNEARAYDPLDVIQDAGMLRVHIQQPGGEWLPNRYCEIRLLDPKRERPKLRPGEFTSLTLPFGNYVNSGLSKPGRHCLEVSLEIDGSLRKSSLEFDVVELRTYAIRDSHELPLAGHEATLPVNEQTRAFVQQVEIGNRNWLIYRRNLGSRWGGYASIVRLAELPGKTEVKVTGTYGDDQPITIAYKDTASRTGTTTLVISPMNGMPWTAEEARRIESYRAGEERWREKQKFLPPLPPPPYELAPAPRPVRP